MINKIRTGDSKVKRPGMVLAWPICLILWNYAVLGAFEVVGSGPRSAGMGGGGVAIVADAWSATRNPASSAFSSGMAGFTWSRQFGIPELTRVGFVGQTRVRGFGLAVAGSQFGSKVYRETGIGLSGSRMVHDRLLLGFEFGSKQIGINEYGNGTAWPVSTGLLLEPGPSILVGAVWRNANRPRFSRYRDRLEQSLDVGVSARVRDRGLVMVDVVQEPRFPAEVRLGLELMPRREVALRAGFRAEPVRPSAGFTVQTSRWTLHYGGDMHPDLGASHEIGLELRR